MVASMNHIPAEAKAPPQKWASALVKMYHFHMSCNAYVLFDYTAKGT